MLDTTDPSVNGHGNILFDFCLRMKMDLYTFFSMSKKIVAKTNIIKKSARIYHLAPAHSMDPRVPGCRN